MQCTLGNAVCLSHFLQVRSVLVERLIQMRYDRLICFSGITDDLKSPATVTLVLLPRGSQKLKNFDPALGPSNILARNPSGMAFVYFDPDRLLLRNVVLVIASSRFPIISILKFVVFVWIFSLSVPCASFSFQTFSSGVSNSPVSSITNTIVGYERTRLYKIECHCCNSFPVLSFLKDTIYYTYSENARMNGSCKSATILNNAVPMLLAAHARRA